MEFWGGRKNHQKGWKKELIVYSWSERNVEAISFFPKVRTGDGKRKERGARRRRLSIRKTEREPRDV